MKNLCILFLFRVRSCVIDGIKYTHGSAIVCALLDELPHFGKVIEFLITPQHVCYFIIYPLFTQVYSHHFHAYEVELQNETEVFHSEKLVDYHPLVCTKPVGYKGHSLFVSPKYHIFK